MGQNIRQHWSNNPDYNFPKGYKKYIGYKPDWCCIRVHFCDDAVSSNVFTNKHYIHLDSDEDSISMNIRVKEIFITPEAGSAGYTIYAELTNIDPDKMYSYNVAGIEGISD